MADVEDCVLLYCRAGYEAELAAECEFHVSQAQSYGYSIFAKNDGFIYFFTPTPQKLPKLSSIIFARQKLIRFESLELLDKSDRIATITDTLKTHGLSGFNELIVEHADTEEGKVLAKFCRKFTVPLRNQLRQMGILSKHKTSANETRALHLFFKDFENCDVCTGVKGDSSQLHQGILRLKFPTDAPSRSTLKLEEAINVFFTPKQAQANFNDSSNAVDLGACPGGWTYQLVKRGMQVQAVDNGPMDDKLMASGLVEHFRHDGFSYQPTHGRVDWLVCDMIENPVKVARLMVSWLTNGLANGAIFNLKLPMKRKFALVQEILKDISKQLERSVDYTIQAKHLYHDRDEITVCVVINGL